jgi:hypothetical protein
LVNAAIIGMLLIRRNHLNPSEIGA